MRVPLSWLREFVDVPAGTTPDEILASLVSVGFEEEDVHRFELTGPIVVGEVLSFEDEPQSNGKTIRWCQVDVGPEQGGTRGIVCGAANFFAGDKVVVTLPGAVLPGPFPIAARKTYGHTSDGMIASAKELGLGSEHSGILRLAELGIDAPVGTDAIALLGLDDVAVEINVTPDRGYALSLRGVAREYAHATGAAFRDPALRPVAELDPGTGFPVAIADDAPIRGRVGVTEFVVRTVRGVDAARPTPPWMITRLALAGIRSISLLVDITNYVMLELGNPIHGYDLDRLTGGLSVRRARAGETLETLDGQTRTLHAEDLVIADESGAIGLAGVMGGAATEMSRETRDVLVEAATFDPTTVARTARRHKLPSEASRRFERGVDPAVALAAAQRVVDLLVQLAGGTVDPLGSAQLPSLERETIDLPAGFVPGLIGVDYTGNQVRGALELIGCAVAETASGWRVTPPTWRPDLTDKWTLAEEVARIEGYDRIPSVVPRAPAGRGLTAAQRGRRRVSNALASAGLVETPSFPFTTPEQNDLHSSASGTPQPSVRLANPMDGQAPVLRRSLVPGLLQVAHRNVARGLVDLALFETGVVFLPRIGVEYGTPFVPPLAVRPDAATLVLLDEAVPPQPRHVGVLFAGHAVAKRPGQPAVAADLADLFHAVRVIAAAAGVDVTFAQGERAALHPGRTAVVRVGDVEIGYAGELLPAVAEASDLPGRVLVAELDLDLLLELAGARTTAASLSPFPAATQDVSLVVDAGLPADALRDALVEGAGELLESARLVDDYRGAGVDAGRKVLTFALRFRAPDRTLTAAEATEAKLAGVAVAESRHGARIRD
ncbi:phenylalanine--tRNA ligase subunit beta [Microbacterium sp. X-17]|uniref:phenylalanine--tRNA ligase subunit beta n=1 Tax=Microbacterium sp. X-17 TaxID=3144404 RepID=UPI0031F4BED9